MRNYLTTYFSASFEISFPSTHSLNIWVEEMGSAHRDQCRARRDGFIKGAILFFYTTLPLVPQTMPHT